MMCGGTLIRLADAGWKIHIATTTAGNCGSMTETPWKISAIRTEEARKAAATIGAEYHCLGEWDGFVCYDKPALRKTYDLFRRVAPSLVFTHPLRDYMMDHEQAALLARAASFLYPGPNVSSVPRKPESVIPWLYYVDPAGGTDLAGADVEPKTLVDITACLPRKEAMLALHASQREWLRAHHGMDEYIESMKRLAARRGKRAGRAYAEGFVQHRGHPYPQNDLLQELFGG
jgi:LmbE family N-acetylglucosaminyl deacetylase